MRYVAAYLLAVLGGNANPSAKDIKSILDSVGIEADDERLNKVISELNGKDINEVVNSGLSKLASVPAGGAVAAPAAAAAGGGAGLRLLLWKRKRKRRKKNQKSPTKIWALVSLINLPSLCLKSNKNVKGLHKSPFLTVL
uniref:Large ribosomal subunit protein P2 n=1 Tax=Oreochromis niloticus TaxID=8128 RepID=A0A669EIJ9_ORENI